LGHEWGPIYENVLRVVEAADGELIATGTFPLSVLEQLDAVRFLIDEGCSGFMILPFSEAMFAQLAEMSEEAGVYWATSMRPIYDRQIKQIVDSSPYFAGLVQENDEETAYEIVRQLSMEGKRKMALIMPGKLDSVGEARARGLYKAANEYGVEVAVEISNATTDEDIYHVISDVIAANPDLDSVFRVGSMIFGSSQAAIRAIRDSGRDIIYASIDIEGITEEDFEDGIVALAAGGHFVLDSVLAAGILVNAINGTPISPNGPAAVTINYLTFRSAQDLREYNQAQADNGWMLFSQDAAKNMLLKKYNSALSQEDYDVIAAVYSLDYPDVLKSWNPD